MIVALRGHMSRALLLLPTLKVFFRSKTRLTDIKDGDKLPLFSKQFTCIAESKAAKKVIR